MLSDLKVYLLDSAIQIMMSRSGLSVLWKLIWSFDINQDDLMGHLFNLMLLPGTQLASVIAAFQSLMDIEPSYRMKFRDGFREFFTIVIERDPSLSWLQFYVDLLQSDPIAYNIIHS